MAATDEALMVRVGLRDQDALGELYRRTRSRALAAAVRTLRDPHLAEDVVQDVFARLAQSARSYDPTRPAFPWLVTLVHRRAIDVVRQRGRRPTAPLGEGASGWVTDDDVARRELVRDVRATLDVLPPSEREVLCLAYYGGMSQSEVAAYQGKALGTVKTQTFVGLGRMRARMNANRLPSAA